MCKSGKGIFNQLLDCSAELAAIQAPRIVKVQQLLDSIYQLCSSEFPVFSYIYRTSGWKEGGGGREWRRKKRETERASVGKCEGREGRRLGVERADVMNKNDNNKLVVMRRPGRGPAASLIGPCCR